ncbi:MAG TPA: hypothetical protein VHV77_04975 [Pirellulales bacterium]|nr:hypothetical protein [Pirellulales bacterium]
MNKGTLTVFGPTSSNFELAGSSGTLTFRSGLFCCASESCAPVVPTPAKTTSKVKTCRTREIIMIGDAAMLKSERSAFASVCSTLLIGETVFDIPEATVTATFPIP